MYFLLGLRISHLRALCLCELNNGSGNQDLVLSMLVATGVCTFMDHSLYYCEGVLA